MGFSPDANVQQLPRNCMTCGRQMEWNANVCPYCGHDYRYVAAPLAKQRSSKPVVGGALIILAGILALTMGMFLMVIGPEDVEAWGYSPSSGTDPSISELVDMAGTCGAISIVMGGVAVIGGIFAVTRKNFALAIVGGILGMLGMGFAIGAVLGLVGLILVAMSRKEF